VVPQIWKANIGNRLLEVAPLESGLT